jgi:hypothetical protein
VSLQGKSTKFEAGATCALFPCEDWVRFWKEYILHIRGFKVVKFTFYSK